MHRADMARLSAKLDEVEEMADSFIREDTPTTLDKEALDDLQVATAEATHYLLVGQDWFKVHYGDFTIEYKKEN